MVHIRGQLRPGREAEILVIIFVYKFLKTAFISGNIYEIPYNLISAMKTMKNLSLSAKRGHKKSVYLQLLC